MRPAQKTRPVNHVGASVDQRREQGVVIVGVVFQVGVLHHHDRIAGGGKAQAQRGALAAVSRVEQASHARIAVLLEHLARAVGRSVIDRDHLALKAAIEHPADRLESTVAASL